MNEPTKIKTTPSDFFLHLGIIVALYISAISLVNLLFSVINKAYPDVLNYYDSTNGALRFAVAALIIMFPLYLFLGWIYDKQLRTVPEKKSLTIRKWLVYFTLFIAGLTLAIDLIFLVNSLLGGEVTMRFILKVLSVFVIAGIIFSYYLSDVRAKVMRHTKLMRTYGTIALVLVVGSIIAGFVVVGSPAKQRNVRFDEQRLNDIQNIQWQVINYWQNKASVPATLEALNDPISNYTAPVDPQTKTVYGYQKTGDRSFKICATFALPSQPNQNQLNYPNGAPSYPAAEYSATNEKIMIQDSWQHEAGTQCFDRTIDPDVYPVRTKSSTSTKPL